MSNIVSIDAYNLAEKRARVSASYPALRAFVPTAFIDAGFPTHVSEESELLRYADIMSELSPETLLKDLYSPREIELLSVHARNVRALTSQRFGRAVRPLKGPLTQMPLLRAVEALAGSSRPTVWEIGGGSGHLGSLLLQQGFPYRAIEVTQALYLWQNRLFSWIAKSFRDYATEEGAPGDGDEQCALIPWWRFATLYKDPPKADIVICEAALGEVSQVALHYILGLSREMLRSSPIGALLYRRQGEPRTSSANAVADAFQHQGLVFQQFGPVSCWTTEQRDLSRAAGLPFVGGGEPRQLDEGYITRTDETPEAYEFFRFLRWGAG